MPPKKSSTPVTNSNGDVTLTSDGNAKFTWEGPNDYKLLLLTQGRYVKPEEYEQLATAFTGDTSTGSIRNRVSKLRVLQRNLYEELGWQVPEGGAGHSAKKTGGGAKKRGASGGDEEEGTPSKKPRAKKVLKKNEDEEASGDGEKQEGGEKIKEEIFEDEI